MAHLSASNSMGGVMPRVIHRRRFRAIVLWTVASFVIMQLLLGWAIDAGLPQVRDPEYVHREQLLQAQTQSDSKKPQVVMIGSSRVLNGLDAKTATEALAGDALVFNFGIPSSGPFLERVWQERLEAGGAKPAILLIEVFPAYFNGNCPAGDRNDLDGARLTARELSQLRPTFEAVAGPIRRWVFGRSLPAYRNQSELRGLLYVDRRRNGDDLPPDLRAIDSFGWQPRGYEAEERIALTGLAHRQYDPCYRDFRLSAEQVSHLEELLERCHRRGIRAALVLTPEGSEFRRLYTPEMTADIDGMLSQMRAKYQVPIIDARNWMDDGRFYDMHHLLPSGAREFSQRLAREGIAPLLQRHVSLK
jgi:hypothetical protein